MSLLTCFIDLQKAYDTVDRTLLSKVLTPIEVPPQMIALIQQFHSEMRARVRPDDGVCSELFEVEQRLRQRSSSQQRGLYFSNDAAKIRSSSPSWYT